MDTLNGLFDLNIEDDITVKSIPKKCICGGNIKHYQAYTNFQIYFCIKCDKKYKIKGTI